jgi:hypothetical protein
MRFVRSILAFASALALAACGHAQPVPTTPGAAAVTAAPGEPKAIDRRAARAIFDEIDRVARADAGTMWGHSLVGPMIFVDPATRDAVANEGDPAGVLRAGEGVFAGSWPKDQLFANTAVDWQGKRWTMVMWGAVEPEQNEKPAARRGRLALLAHESFHRIQPALALVSDDAGLSAHLDTEQGRLLLELEWRALEAALGAANDSKEASDATADALTFRAVRRALFPNARTREGALETMEGLAEYTGARLAGFSDAEVVAAATKRAGREQGFVRSFAYVSGPLYGFLLDRVSPGWRRQITKTSDLGALLAEAMGIALPSSASSAELDARADRYDGAALRAAESARARARAERIAEWRRTLVDGPVLVIASDAVTSMSFDPGRISLIDDAQAVYVSSALMGPFGTLSVAEDGTMLRDSNAGESRVSLAGADASVASGAGAEGKLRGRGWVLELAPGWQTVPGKRAGDRVLVRQAP